VIIKTIKYYENTEYSFKKGKKKNPRKCNAQQTEYQYRQNMNVLPNLWSHL